jgi:hypothetical protein
LIQVVQKLFSLSFLLDNLFTSSKLLSTLRDYGIGAAGTVRTSKTKREENKEKKEKQELEDQDLSQDLDPLQDLDSLQDLDLSQNGHLQSALDLIREIKEDLDQNLIPQINSQGRTTEAKKPEKERNFGMNEKLIELKTKWSNHIAWGKLYGCLSSDQKWLIRPLPSIPRQLMDSGFVRIFKIMLLQARMPVMEYV